MESTNLITAQQLFWGHDGLKYGFLSGKDSPYASEVERLCAVGTPDGAVKEPFLLSVPCNDKLFWARCSNGKPDNSNRPTLFFHILIVSRADVERLGINAFDVMESNCFSDSVDSSSTVEICVNSRFRPKNNDSNHRVIDNRVIISNRPEPDAVFQLVQPRINDISWATFSYRFMNQMEVSTLSNKAPEPEFTSSTPDNNVNVQNENNNPVPSANMKKLLCLSLLLNVVLLLGYFFTPGVSPTNTDVTLEKPEVTIQKLRDEFKNTGMAFKKDDWTKAKEVHPAISRIDPKDETIKKIEAYIKFVNNKIIKDDNYILPERNDEK